MALFDKLKNPMDHEGCCPDGRTSVFSDPGPPPDPQDFMSGEDADLSAPAMPPPPPAPGMEAPVFGQVSLTADPLAILRGLR